ncbi:MAG: cupin domain-containing protein [Dehalococcoidia bacterium]
MRLEQKTEQDYEAAPGLFRTILVTSERLMLVRFLFQTGAEAPTHTHPHEQDGFCLFGHVEMWIGDQTLDLRAGDSYAVPSGVPHGARALEPSAVIDAFAPPREDFLAQEAKP